MNAVATPRKAKPANASEKPSPDSAHTAGIPTRDFPQAAIQTAFGQVELLLKEALAINEVHPWSGDSERLLLVASGLAGEARANPPTGDEIECAAFDIAALVRAARLVPGDVESPPRKALINQAAVHLNWLTECDTGGQDCCDPCVPRPSAPNARAPSKPTNTSEEAECLELARRATYEIEKLAETMQVMAEHFGNEEHPIANGIAARTIVLAEIVFHAAALHGEGRSESRSLNELRRAFKGRI